MNILLYTIFLQATVGEAHITAAQLGAGQQPVRLALRRPVLAYDGPLEAVGGPEGGVAAAAPVEALPRREVLRKKARKPLES